MTSSPLETAPPSPAADDGGDRTAKRHDGTRHGSLVETATEAIRSQIAEGRLTAGDRLPPERTLVEELNVSRTVLREALSSLEALGLIETRATRGRFVTSGGSSERSRALVSAWLHQHAGEIFEGDEIRSVLESHVIRSMSPWGAIDAARRAAAILRQQVEAVERSDALEAAKLDLAFHRLLCSYTSNNTIKTLVEGLAGESRRETLAVYSLPEASRRSLEQHQQIVRALEASDVEQAAEIASAHMIDAARRFGTRTDDGAGPCGSQEPARAREAQPPLLDGRRSRWQDRREA
jgi:GntR family transcriptional repressor for pyruvate dehydrogenase complex